MHDAFAYILNDYTWVSLAYKLLGKFSKKVEN